MVDPYHAIEMIPKSPKKYTFLKNIVDTFGTQLYCLPIQVIPLGAQKKGVSSRYILTRKRLYGEIEIMVSEAEKLIKQQLRELQFSRQRKLKRELDDKGLYYNKVAQWAGIPDKLFNKYLNCKAPMPEPRLRHVASKVGIHISVFGLSDTF